MESQTVCQSITRTTLHRSLCCTRRALAPQLGLALAAQRLASWLLAWNYFIGVLVCGTTCHWDGHFHENESILLVHQWRTCFH